MIYSSIVRCEPNNSQMNFDNVEISNKHTSQFILCVALNESESEKDNVLYLEECREWGHTLVHVNWLNGWWVAICTWFTSYNMYDGTMADEKYTWIMLNHFNFKLLAICVSALVSSSSFLFVALAPCLLANAQNSPEFEPYSDLFFVSFVFG